MFRSVEMLIVFHTMAMCVAVTLLNGKDDTFIQNVGAKIPVANRKGNLDIVDELEDVEG